VLADGTDGYIELILEYVARLQTNLKTISREQEKEHTKVTGDVDKAGMKRENIGVGNIKVNLPKLHLPFFDGNIQYWPEFLNPKFMNKICDYVWENRSYCSFTSIEEWWF